MSFFRVSIIAGAVALAMATTAGAATLAISNGGTDILLPSNFNPSPVAPLTAGVTPVTVFNGPFLGSGLSIVGAGGGKLTYTFLGFESDYTNYAIELQGGAVRGTDALPGFVTAVQTAAGLVGFKFTALNTGDTITNGVGGSNALVDLAFSAVFNNGKSVYALFDDGGGNNDNDYDDLVLRIDIAAIPVPAAGLLLLSALGGFAVLRRRRSV